MRRVLMVAYHYPPVRVSSGIHRTLAFSRHLPALGWQPVVLSVHPRAYEYIGNEQMDQVPADIIVERAFALDSARHLALSGRYWGMTALPDRWISWWPGAVTAGLRLIRRQQPTVLWSTYPIATAHLIALTLHRLTGIPWVADFRDSMVDEVYPPPGLQRRAFQWIETQTVNACRRAVFTAPGTRTLYERRYPCLPADRWAVIANGYDEDSFRLASVLPQTRTALKVLRLVHSGLLYPSERDPRPFFTALAKLRDEGRVDGARLRIVLRASGHETYHQALVKELQLQDMVELAPGLPYHQALREMMDADGLLLFQAANCNHQIPAKLYEYLRTFRPIFALVDPQGDTAGLLKTLGIHTMAPLHRTEGIAEALVGFLQLLREGQAPLAAIEQVEQFSRQAQTVELARLLQAASDTAI